MWRRCDGVAAETGLQKCRSASHGCDGAVQAGGGSESGDGGGGRWVRRRRRGVWAQGDGEDDEEGIAGAAVEVDETVGAVVVVVSGCLRLSGRRDMRLSSAARDPHQVRYLEPRYLEPSG